MTIDEAMRALYREYYRENRERILANAKKRRDANPEAFREREREYAAKHKEARIRQNRESYYRRHEKELARQAKRRAQGRLVSQERYPGEGLDSQAMGGC